MKQLGLVILSLLLISTFAFADVIVSPVDYALPLGVLALVGIVIIGLTVGAVGIVYWIYLKVRGKEKERHELLGSLKKSLFSIIIIFVVMLVLLIIFIGIVSFWPRPPTGPSAVYPITHAIRAASPSGTMTTQDFVLHVGESISANIGENFGLDSHSIFFCKSDALKTSGFLSIADVNGLSKINYTGAASWKGRAIVICKQTGEEVLGVVPTYSSDCDGIVDYCGNFQPCCAVVFDKT
jgi:hypothetical protein